MVVKYNRGTGGANNRRLWLSDDLTTLKWADETRLAKANGKADAPGGGTPKSERETTKLALESVVDVEYGRCVSSRPPYGGVSSGLAASPVIGLSMCVSVGVRV